MFLFFGFSAVYFSAVDRFIREPPHARRLKDGILYGTYTRAGTAVKQVSKESQQTLQELKVPFYDLLSDDPSLDPPMDKPAARLPHAACATSLRRVPLSEGNICSDVSHVSGSFLSNHAANVYTHEWEGLQGTSIFTCIPWFAVSFVLHPSCLCYIHLVSLNSRCRHHSWTRHHYYLLNKIMLAILTSAMKWY